MTEAIDPLALRYAGKMRTLLGDRLKELWLFGSRARGDHHEDSDYDILIVADADRREIQEATRQENHRMLDEYSELFGCVIYSSAVWKMASIGPLGMNIRKTGQRLI